MALEEKDQSLWNRYNRSDLVARFEHLEDPYYKELISNEDLPIVIAMHNAEIKRLLDAEKKDIDMIKMLYWRNKNFCRLANFRGIRFPDRNFMFVMATELGENLGEAYQDLFGENLTDRRIMCQTYGYSVDRKNGSHQRTI